MISRFVAAHVAGACGTGLTCCESVQTKAKTLTFCTVTGVTGVHTLSGRSVPPPRNYFGGLQLGP